MAGRIFGSRQNTAANFRPCCQQVHGAGADRSERRCEPSAAKLESVGVVMMVITVVMVMTMLTGLFTQ
jgi:hypothetical protein